MIKKTILSLLLAIAALCSAAQGWQLYPVFADKIDDIVLADNKVYYLSGGHLFSYSPTDKESYSYNPINKLSGSDIVQMRYNPEGGYLLIIYADSNIDVLYDNGKLVNLPDIRDAHISGSKNINDVAFGEGRIVIGADFGLVVYDEAKMQVIESGMYSKPVWCVAVMDGNILIFTQFDSSYYIAYSPIDMRHNSLDKFKKLGDGAYIRQMMPIDNSTMLVMGRNDYKLTLRNVDLTEGKYSLAKDCGVVAKAEGRLCDFGYFMPTDRGLALLKDGDVTTVDLPEMLLGQKVTLLQDPDIVWAGDADGIAEYDISSATPTVLHDKFKFEGAATCSKPAYMKWSPDGERLYISNMETSVYKSYAIGECTNVYQTTNIIENSFARDASVFDASATHSQSKKWQKENGNARMYGDPAWIIEDPDDPTIYYCANNHEGLYVIKQNKQTGEYEEIGKFDCSNTPIPDNWGARVQDVNIDPKGNLWVGYQKGAHYAVLPADKRRQDPKALTAADWIEHSKLAAFNTLNQRDMMSLFCQHSNMMFVFSGFDSGGLIAIDTKGTYADPSDDAVYHWDRFTDQDGNTFAAPTRTTFALEDSKGRVWIGTSAGVFEITRPDAAISADMIVRRIKVPRNDGTNYADYLLDSDLINWMSLDPAGRKWIATENSGIFLVSANGDKILRNYHADNSPLITNSVCSIECDPSNNLVYVGTPNGLYTFFSDATSPADDYSSILAYPNPVRPEYTGNVTISGLMDNSVVKIADAAGNVVYQTRSEGGMAQWNVCGPNGSRVKTGVYFVFASQTDGTTSSGSVAKIMVVN